MEKDGFQPNDTEVDRPFHQLTRKQDQKEKGGRQ